MTPSVTRNRDYLTDLFAGPFRGHALIMNPELPPPPFPEDYVAYDGPVADWAPWMARTYETRVAWHEALDDDAVPYVSLGTGTEIFAACFGCEIHQHDGLSLSARPLVFSADEADRLPQPTLDAWPLARFFELAARVRERVGAEAPISVPDMQSPFDIAALIWNKEDFFIAMYEEPEAVMRLVAKCEGLLTEFLAEFIRQFPECNLCHCPNAWAPPALGCWLSEDEAGCLTTEMFETFCLPSLVRLSDTFGGLFMHCCATADHQYASFRKIPRLRGLNRVFQEPGPRPAIRAFAGKTVLIAAWTGEEELHAILDMAEPDSRFLFNLPAMPLDEAKRTYARLRERCLRGYYYFGIGNVISGYRDN